MQGAAQRLFAPLAMAVGFAMIGSYILSSTFVPVLSVWLLRHHGESVHKKNTLFDHSRKLYESGLHWVIASRWVVVPAYLAAAALLIAAIVPQLGQEIFPVVNAGQFRMRIRAPDGTHINRSEQYAKDVLALVSERVGRDNVDMTLGYVGMIHSNFPVNAVYQWSRGPEEAILYVDLKDSAGLDIESLKEQLRGDVAKQLPELRVSFEPSDIVNEVMSFGSPTPVELAVVGNSLPDSRALAAKLKAELDEIPSLRDVQYGQSLDYPTIEVNIDREKAGLAGLTPVDISRALVTATSSSRFVVPNYWAEAKSGVAYQVQVEVPRAVLRTPDGMQAVSSAADLARLPVKRTDDGQVLLRDVATLQSGTMPGQFDRYNMKRQVTLTANISGADLGEVAHDVTAAVKRVTTELEEAKLLPKDTKIELRGQITPMQEMRSGLTVGLAVAIAVVFLVLTANFQSLKLALVTVSTVPAVIVGVVAMLFATGTTLNIQSYIGAIMAIGVAMANAILLVTFAENLRREGRDARKAAVQGAGARLRAILMTSCAMVAGMAPMALAWGEAGQQNAPLGRAVIGGLMAATFATLFILPSVFAFVQQGAKQHSASLDPDDPESAHYQQDMATAGA
jgi:multidrug efflux pump subunit AcrB